MQPRQIVTLYGPPGAGKSAQGQLLEVKWTTREYSFNLFGFKLHFNLNVKAKHITTGSLLRNLWYSVSPTTMLPMPDGKGGIVVSAYPRRTSVRLNAVFHRFSSLVEMP